MYITLLTLHSLFRWLVLTSLLFAMYRAYTGWLGNKRFSPFDNTLRHTTATIAQVQLLLGLCLYFISPLIDYFLHHYKEAVHERQIRFFGMEHSLMMLVAVVLITIGSIKAKRNVTDQARFSTIAIWFTIALLCALAFLSAGKQAVDQGILKQEGLHRHGYNSFFLLTPILFSRSSL